ncbi:hypothetical protein E3U55_02395 [Filobacillus milosensis]|uniref:Flagellar protein FliT n=1 Tax=Filobacillus milosensis TaxID=94137 RepID=A0A4Y8IRE1_9BACI|nr:hypothetical protein [Filobacillus milosensis]TFB24371.1 hypothetical protein E3U55_02395 [Filobacillus milosensis]
MPALQDLYVLTTQMVDKFEEDQNENREEMVKTFNFFVNERQKLLKEISAPYSEKELEMGQELVRLDQQLKLLVDDYFTKFKVDMTKLSKKRHSNKKYVNPYANVYGTDGSFIDKKN